ncbi:AzlD domain-containing protein [Ammoniphilus sp. YIM 78166]|uniref:AzlD domain-containing protein n=1 Tax=Ammoniphilus sp. YIM 78166 TaxID=1644106 RepID=UPI0010703F54|nr:AzlD domain-containing protein [Ammoniphilus sp. YIM 78166]
MSIAASLTMMIGMAVVTYLARRAFLRIPDNRLSPRLKQGLTFIPLGIFAGLIFPSLFVQQGEMVIQPLYFAGSIICLILMALTKNVFVSFGLSLLFVVLVTIEWLPWPM